MSRSIRIGGDEMDQDIVTFARREYNLFLGERTAEDIKIAIGSAYPGEWDAQRVTLRGRDLLTGLPRSVEVGADQIREAIEPSVAQIVDTVKDTIEETPPELVADIMDQGIVLAGGGALLAGLDRRVAEATQMPVHVADDPLTCVARGHRHRPPGARRHGSASSSPRRTRARRAERRSGPTQMTIAARRPRRPPPRHRVHRPAGGHPPAHGVLARTRVVRDVQSGIGFAFRPIQGALDRSPAASPRSATAIAEIDRLRVDNAALRDGERPADRPRTRAPRRSTRENEQLTALLQLRARLRPRDGGGERHLAATRRSSGGVIGLDKGSNDGIRVGDVVIAAGRRAGRPGHRGRAGRATVVLLTDAASTVIGQLVLDRRDRPGRRPARRRAGHEPDRLRPRRSTSAIEVVTAGIELGEGVRSPYPKGLLIGQVVDVRRDANDVVQTAYLQPAADLDQLEFVLVITDYEGGLPPIEEQPVDCTREPTARARCPRASSPASRPESTPAPAAVAAEAASGPGAPVRFAR